MKSFFTVWFLMVLLPFALHATYGVQFTVVKGDGEKAYNSFIEKELPALGWVISDPHARINDGYATKFGATKLDNLGFFSISNDLIMRELLLLAPELGGFSPFNFHIYKKKSENKTYIGFIKSKTMLDIVGVDDKRVTKPFSKMFRPLEKAIKKSFGKNKSYAQYENLPKYPMMKFTYTFDRTGDLEDFIDSFQEKFEEKFEAKNYIIAGYKNYKETYDDLELGFDRYDAYFVYSLCHFDFSHSIFEDRPDAGAFAPCSMYMYIEKERNIVHIGMPKLANWTAVMNISNATKKKAITALDTDVIETMKSLGAIEVIPEKLKIENSYKKAMLRAKKENKPVLAFMNQKSCGACKFMKNKVFMKQKMIRYMNKNFVVLYLDILKNDAPKNLQVKATPFFHFLRSDGSKIIETLKGGKNGAKFMPYLEKALKAY